MQATSQYEGGGEQSSHSSWCGEISHGDPHGHQQPKLSLALNDQQTLSGEIEADGEHRDGELMENIGPREPVQRLLLPMIARVMQRFLLGPLQRHEDHQQIKQSLLYHQAAAAAASEPQRWACRVDPTHRRPTTSEAGYTSAAKVLTDN